MDYFEKIDDNIYESLLWNIPEQKQGNVNIIGGSKGNFHNEVRIAELLTDKYPLQNVNLVLPDCLKNELPKLPNFIFLPSTTVGTFDDSQSLCDVFNQADSNLVFGDLSKNQITGKGMSKAFGATKKQTLITRDSVDLLAGNNPDRVLMNEKIIILGSVTQLIKLLRAVYYPKVLLVSQSLIQVTEVLHKFTLSYPISILTLHNGQIMLASNGIVKTVSLDKTDYTPLTIWNGELAAKITTLNIYNPNQFIEASIAAIFE